ncbi:MAG: transporter substrate-binding domain-containing protein [Psychromonas sp.]|nr:transporter substrate-binding domain-containing protein [Psychromonas sp.]
MNEAPDNSGIFSDLYSEAASRIGCKLTITRLPKKRLHKGLQRGEFDFYPAASFSEKRASYLSYIENGLETGEYGISSKKLPEVRRWQELALHSDVIWLMESNSSKDEFADLYGINKQMIHYLNVKKVVDFIRARPNHIYFYVADKEVLDNYLHQTQQLNFAEDGLRIHLACCGHLKPMYLAFSLRSAHFTKVINSNYIEQQKLSEKNQATFASEQSVAHKFSQALKAMHKEGVTDQIYQTWYPH